MSVGKSGRSIGIPPIKAKQRKNFAANAAKVKGYMSLLKEEGWLRHQTLEWAQTGWSAANNLEERILKQDPIMTTPSAPILTFDGAATPPVSGGVFCALPQKCAFPT